MSRLRSPLAAGLVAGFALSGCGAAPKSEESAEALAERVLPSGFSTLDLAYRRELKDGDATVGYAWRLARRASSARNSPPSPTHLGVVGCVRGDAATEAAQFSYLHWDVEGCADARASLRRVERTPEQDASAIGGVIGRPSTLDTSDAVRRATG